MSQSATKIAVQEITIKQLEGTGLDMNKAPLSVATFEDADSILHKIGYQNSGRGDYIKCDFKLVFEDGLVYTGRYDVGHPGISEINLRAHVLNYLEHNAGRRCPRGTTEEAYQLYLTQKHEILGVTRKKFIDFLEKYEVDVSQKRGLKLVA